MSVAIGDLAERALLVHVHIGMWNGTKNNTALARETEQRKGAAAGTVSGTTIRLVPKEEIDPTRTILVETYETNRRLSLPWLDKGTRLIGSETHMDYAATMRSLRDRFETAADVFDQRYPRLMAEAPRRLNSLFDGKDFPPEYRIRRKFHFDVRVLPFPTTRDLRLDMADSQVARLRQDMEESISAAVAEAMKDPYERILETVGHMAKTLMAYQPGKTGQREQGGFHGTLVTNVRDLMMLLPSLNLTRDSNLAAITQRMQKDLCTLDADVLKNDEYQREQTARRANEILAAVQEFIA